MDKLKKAMVGLLGILSLVTTLEAAEKPPFIIATNGAPQAVVVAAKDAPAVTKETARFLAEYLGRLSGASFMVAEKPVAPYKSIVVGTPYKPSKREELCIRVKDANTLEVTGDGPLGTRYAAQELVEHFGVVFCSSLYESIPKHAGLALPGDFVKIDAPFMDGRCGVPLWTMMIDGSDFPMKLRYNLTNNDSNLTNYNSYTELQFLSSSYYKLFPEHHAFGKDGKRSIPLWFCPCEEELYPKLFAAVEKDILAGRKMISLGIDDGGLMCQCDKCKKLIHVVNEKYPNGRDYPSIQNITLINRVAKHFKDKYPDVLFTMLAYLDFPDAPPPEVVTLEPNVSIGIALLWRNFGRPVSACERALLQHDDWAKLFPKDTRGGIYIWDYYANFCSYIQPFPNLDTMGMNLRHYKANGVKMVCPQLPASNIGELIDLNYWLLGKLCWNPDADDQALIDQYLNAAYGKAAHCIREYLDIIEHARDRHFGTWIGCYSPNTDSWLTGEDCVRVFRLWERAHALSGRDFARRRHLNASRFSILTMALIRYNDMIEPAKKMRYKLPSREKILADWTAISEVARAQGRSLDYAEGNRLGMNFEMFFEELLKTPPQATHFKKTKSSYVFTAKDMSGGKKMEKRKDADGTEYARLSVKLSGEDEGIFMNPAYSEAGVTLGEEHEGEWYVFATVRTGATVPYDRASAYVGIYRPSHVSTANPTQGGDMEIANLPVIGRKGDTEWQTICLGKYPLYAKTRLWMMNGVLEPTDFADVKSFTLVDPVLIEGASQPILTDSRSTIIDARKLKGANRKPFEMGRDKIDNFQFARIANTNKATAIEYTITKNDAGECDVFAVVRIDSDVEFDPAAATIELVGSLHRAIIKSEYGNRGWQVVSLGRQTLAEGDTLRFSPVMKAELKSADIRAFVLIKPEVMTASVPAFDKTWDVVIYGSSPAAFTAAIEAQSHGKNVVIVSPETRLGGLTTGGLGATDIGHKSAYGGLALKFYQDIATYYSNSNVWKQQKRSDYKPPAEFGGVESMWSFEPSAALNVLTAWEKDNKLNVVRGEKLDRGEGGVFKEGVRITAIRTLSGKVFAGKMFVDATYEGDLMAVAGVSYTVGREANSLYGETWNGMQRTNAVYHQLNKGVDPYVKKGDPKSGLLPGIELDTDLAEGAGDKRVQAYCFRMCLTDDPKNRIPFQRPAGYRSADYELLFRNLEAIDPKELEKDLRAWMPWINSPMPNRKTDTNNRTGVSTDFIGANYDWAEGSYEKREEILAAHLKYQQGLMWTLAYHPRVPKIFRNEFSKWGTCRDEFRDGLGGGWQSQLYVREARRMVGDMVMTEGHCRHLKEVSRPIAMGSYGMDSHNVRRYVGKDGFAHNEGNIEIWGNTPYGIDYGAIIPKKAECENLFVPVCLSASHIAFGSIRMEPVFFALGQSAGAAASLAIDANCAVQDVPYAKLRTVLDAKGQVVELK